MISLKPAAPLLAVMMIAALGVIGVLAATDAQAEPKNGTVQGFDAGIAIDFSAATVSFSASTEVESDRKGVKVEADANSSSRGIGGTEIEVLTVTVSPIW